MRATIKLSLISVVTVLSFIVCSIPAFAQTTAVSAIIDDFDDEDPQYSFLNLWTSAGEPNSNGGDLVASYDIFGANMYSPLNTAHQLSWDGSLGNTLGPDTSYWYSIILDAGSTVVPVGDFDHLSFVVQTGLGGYVNPANSKRDVVGIDLQVNDAGDPEGKGFRIFRAYQPLGYYLNMDSVNISFSDFRDEYDSGISFTDDLQNNLNNLKAVSVVMTDSSDDFLTDNDGDGYDMNLDNYGTLFIEDVRFWHEGRATVAQLLVDDFEDGNAAMNNLGFPTGGIGTSGSDADEVFMGSWRHRVTWNITQPGADSYEWQSVVGQAPGNLLDISGYTHLAYDIKGSPTDMADFYEVTLMIDNSPDNDLQYIYVIPAGSTRIHEEYIPLESFHKDIYGLALTAGDMTRVKEIRFRFGKQRPWHSTTPYYTPDPIYSDFDGQVWVDNLKFVQLQEDPLYNYPPIITTIDGQDVTDDLDPVNVFARKKYDKAVEVGQDVGFVVIAEDPDASGLLNLSLEVLTPLDGSYLWHVAYPSTGGRRATFTWTPTVLDHGVKTLKFTASDAQGPKDIQKFDIIVTDPNSVPSGWPIVTELNDSNSPTVIDIDGDGEMEIVIANEAYHADGTRLWSVFPTTSVKSRSTAVGDITDDPGLESVFLAGPQVGYNQTLYLVSADGQLLATFPADVIGSPVLADIDGDGFMEILALDKLGIIDSSLVALEWNPSLQILEEKWRLDNDQYVDFTNTPVPVDLDGDNIVEKIILIEDPGVLQVYTVNQGAIPPVLEWEVAHGLNSSTPAVGDIDGDGDPEIVFCNGYRWHYVNVFAYEFDGNPVSGQWPLRLSDHMLESNFMALGDVIGGDSAAAEIVLGLYDVLAPVGQKHYIAVIDGDGSIAFEARSFPGPQPGITPAIADIDNDGQNEIVVVSDREDVTDRYYIYAIGNNGSIEDAYPLDFSGWEVDQPNTSVAISDIDSNGDVDIIVALQRHALLLDLASPYDPKNMEWPMFRHDPANTGVIYPKVTADFSASPTSGTAPLTVNFTDSSTSSVQSYYWRFGDTYLANSCMGVFPVEYTSTEQNPTHTYTEPGTYTVKLTVSTGPYVATVAEGAEGHDTMTKVAYITVYSENAVVANFTGSPTSGMSPLAVNFTDLSTGNVTSRSWDFGDGIGTSTVQNPRYTYQNPGIYTVSLTVTGPERSDTMTKTNYISASAPPPPPPPVSNFTSDVTTGDDPLTVNFQDQSSGSISSWSWDFGDGIGTSAQQNPAYTYESPGTYTVSLTATGPGGSNIMTRIDYITATQPFPYVDFTTDVTTGPAPLNVKFTGQWTGNLNDFLYDFGDGQTKTGKNTNHTYSTPGTYTVTLTGSGPDGSDSETKVDYIVVTVP